MAAAQQRDRRLGGAEQRDFAVLRSRRRSARGASPCPRGIAWAVARERAGMRFRRAAILAETTIAASRPNGGRPPRRALLGLLRVEALGVARQQRRDHGMLGLQASAAARGPGLSPRPARPVAWRSNWKVRSAARGSPLARPTSASTTPTSVKKRKIVALGDELRADDDVVVAARGRRELRAQALQAAGRCRRTAPAVRALGNSSARLLGEPLDAGAAGGEAVGLGAGRADIRPLLDMAAMMADQRVAEAVLDQPGRAVRALEAMAAGAAEGQRRIAAPVEEQERLLARGQRPPRSPAIRRGDSQRPRGGPSRCRSTAARSGMVARAEAARQPQPAIAAAVRR